MNTPDLFSHEMDLASLVYDPNRNPLPLGQFVHENLSIVMTFAYSRLALLDMLGRRFTGGGKYLEKAIFTMSEHRALRACYEAALYLRTIDDEQKVSEYHEVRKSPFHCGMLFADGEADAPLTFRQSTNKIIHSTRMEWDFERGKDPILICHKKPDEQGPTGKKPSGPEWRRAEIDIALFAAACGMLGS